MTSSTPFADVVEAVLNQQSEIARYRTELRDQLLEAIAALRAADGNPVTVALPIPTWSIEPGEHPAATLRDFGDWRAIREALDPVYEAIEAQDLDRAEALLGDEGPLAALDG